MLKLTKCELHSEKANCYLWMLSDSFPGVSLYLYHIIFRIIQFNQHIGWGGKVWVKMTPPSS